MIQLRDLEKSYKLGNQRVLACRVPELLIAKGEHVAILGRSGCGKSTLLHLISGLLLPDRGSIKVRGLEMTKLSERARDRFRAKHLGYVHQTFNLLAAYDALHNVMLGAFFAGMPHSGMAEAKAMLGRVGLGDRLSHKPKQLSVGQQQRVAIARALIKKPEILLADEPLGNQDPETGKESLGLMLEIAKEMGTTVVIVTHDDQTADLLHRKVVLPDHQRVSGDVA